GFDVVKVVEHKPADREHLEVLEPGVSWQMAQLASFRDEGERNNSLKSPPHWRLRLQFPQRQQLFDAFSARLDVAVENGGVGADAQFVGGAMDFHPAIRAELALEYLIVHAIVEDFRPPTGHRAQAGFTQGDEDLARGEPGNLGEVIDFDGG